MPVCQHLVQHHPEREEIDPRVDAVTLDLLGRHVSRVPTITPVIVCRVACGMPSGDNWSFASPKSRIFTRRHLMKTLSGFRSR